MKQKKPINQRILISIIVPCLNEAQNIGKVISGIKKNINSDFEVIVVDNNSQDKTAEIARSKGVKLIKENKKGKGIAIMKGVSVAKGNFLVFIDGDGSYYPEFISKIINKLIKSESDIVYGSRFLKESKAKISSFRLFGNKFFSFLGFLLYNQRVDFLTGFFAIKKDKFFKLKLESTGFEIETEIFKKAIKKKLKINQIPIRYKANKESKINPIIDGFKIFFTLIKNKKC